MRVVVPFDAVDPKTRLGDRLDPAERSSFAYAMLRDVLEVVRAAGGSPEVLSTADLSSQAGLDHDVPVTIDERPLTPAVNDRLDAADDALAVVMADLALATPDAVARLLAADGRVVLVPGRGGGTNALVVRDTAFRVDFHGASIRDHRRIAAEAGIEPTIVDSYRLSTDVDEPTDLPEVLLHGEGRAADWLRENGFDLVVDDGRVAVARE